jgi:hypothetical protein
MFLLNDVLNKFRNAGLASNISLLLDNNKFSNEIYLHSATEGIPPAAFKNIYTLLLLADKPNANSKPSFLVSKIDVWLLQKGDIVNNLIEILEKDITTSTAEIPPRLIGLISKFYSDVDNVCTIIEISCVNDNENLTIDLFKNTSYFNDFGVNLLSNTVNHPKLIRMNNVKKDLVDIRIQKLFIDKAIEQNLIETNGRLTGIRHVYSHYNIDTKLVCLFYNLDSIDDYERLKKLAWYTEKNIEQVNTIKVVVNKSALADKGELNRKTLLYEINVPRLCKPILEKINKFTKNPLDIGQLLDTDESKLEWLNGVTPEMIHAFREFKVKLADDISSFSSKEKIIEKETPQNTVYDVLSVSLQQLKLPIPFSNLLQKLERSTDTSMTVGELLDMDNLIYLNSKEIAPRDFVIFSNFKRYIKEQLDSNSIEDFFKPTIKNKNIESGKGETDNSIENSDVGYLAGKQSDNFVKGVATNSVQRNLIEDERLVDGCHFINFNKKNEICIEIQALKSLDAFELESINNKLIVIINSKHPFYSKLYRDSSIESKRVIDMMISSLCHLSHLNISETVKQQDRRLFSRWSEYLEEYLLEE